MKTVQRRRSEDTLKKWNTIGVYFLSYSVCVTFHLCSAEQWSRAKNFRANWSYRAMLWRASEYTQGCKHTNIDHHRHRSLVHVYSSEHLISPAATTLRVGRRAGDYKLLRKYTFLFCNITYTLNPMKSKSACFWYMLLFQISADLKAYKIVLSPSTTWLKWSS